MAVNPVSVKTEQSNKNAYRKDIAFRGAGFNPILMIMDGIDKGGFMASFLAQDTLGMVCPRIGAGLTRNSDKTGEPNYKYASLVAVREFLTGPSVFVIPMTLLYAIKSRFGKANDVPITFIKGIGDDFAEFASQHPQLKDNPAEMKKAYYRSAVANVLDQSTQGNFSKDNKKLFDKTVDELTQNLIDMDEAKQIKYWWSPKNDANGQPIKYVKDIKAAFIAKFVEMKKLHSHHPEGRMFQTYFSIPNKITGAGAGEYHGKPHLKTAVDCFVDNLRNFTDDATKSLSQSGNGSSIKESVQSFIHKRVGSRFLTIMSMSAAVVLFFLYIPKIYNSVCKENPELAGLVDEEKPKAVNPAPVTEEKEEGV